MKNARKREINKITGLGIDLNFDVALLNRTNCSCLDGFNCGVPSINMHIQNFAWQDDTERYYLVVDTDRQRAIGVFSLSCTALISSDEQGKATYRSAIEIVTFAIDVNYQDMLMTENKEDGYLSDIILCYAINKSINIHKYDCAAEVIILYSRDDAVHFYERTGFESFTQFMPNSDSYIEGCIPMYLPLRECKI